MPTTSQLVDLLQKGQAQVKAFAAGLSDVERSNSGTSDNWGPRDILAHIGVVVLRWAGTLAHAEAPAPEGNPATVNQAMFVAYRSRPWNDIAVLLERAYPALIDQVRAFSDEEINDPGHFPWMDGTPIWRQTAGLGFVHPTTHLFQAYLQAGDTSAAMRVGSFEMEQCLNLDNSTGWLGLIYYNQACRLALLGVPDRALTELRRALDAAPIYAGFAREDTDFVSLHNDPRFIEIVGTPSF